MYQPLFTYTGSIPRTMTTWKSISPFLIDAFLLSPPPLMDCFDMLHKYTRSFPPAFPLCFTPSRLLLEFPTRCLEICDFQYLKSHSTALYNPNFMTAARS